MQSQKYQLNVEDGIKILKVFGWLLASTTISFLLTLLPMIDAGSMAWLIPIANIVLVSARKFLKDNS